jgi:outer membrane protein TolC
MKALFLLMLTLLPLTVLGRGAQGIADQYAQYALSHNPSLMAEKRDLDLARTDRQSAFGAFLPVVDLQSRHSWADGGRDIVFDVNDFLPSDLLTADLPETVIPFLRVKEQETKVIVKQPLFAGGGILHGYRAARKAEHAARANYDASSANLILAVHKNYYGYLQSRELTAIEEHQKRLAAEQLRVTRALFEVDKTTLGELRRAEAGFAAAEARLIAQSSREEIAKETVNLLLGRELTEDVELPTDDLIDESVLDVSSNTPQVRPELKQLDFSVAALTEQKRATRSNFLPVISAAFEYGYQGEKYDFKDDADYYLLSGVMSWNLFEGFRSNLKRQRVELARRQLVERREWLHRNIQREISAAQLELRSKRAERTAVARALEAADESYRLSEIRYREGMSSQLELTDAQAMLARASAQDVLARFGFLIALADYTHSIGLLPSEVK